jgi:hypothetical protein
MNTSTLSPEASAVERIEHIQKKVCMMWASPELDAYLNSLLMDSREGKRQGFPVEVTQDLLFLAEFNKFVRAIDVAKRLRIPLKEAYQKVDFDDRTKSGTGLDDPLSAGDVYAREASLMGIGNSRNARASSSPAEKKEEGNVGASFGKMIFSLLTNPVVIFLIVLAIIYKIVSPYLFK